MLVQKRINLPNLTHFAKSSHATDVRKQQRQSTANWAANASEKTHSLLIVGHCADHGAQVKLLASTYTIVIVIAMWYWKENVA